MSIIEKKMKKTPRCPFEYEDERNRDLVSAYKKVLAETSGIFQRQVFAAVVKMPASRFYVNEERAERVVSAMYRRPLPESTSDGRRRMYEDIKTRVDRVRSRCPEWSLARCIDFVVSQPAPEFYLSEWTVRNIISEIRKQRITKL